jgi:hypothetical protein
MSVESRNLVSMATVARSSSTRAYAGHSHEMRHVFDIKKLNLTEFARQFGLYKNTEKDFQMSKKRAQRDKNGKEGDINNDDEEQFKKRLMKAKQKELERKLIFSDDKDAEKINRQIK